MPVIKRVARFDELGNRLTSTDYKDVGTTTSDATTYTINDLNQYASRTNARGLIISGMAPQDQSVMLTVKTDLNLATPNTALNNQPAELQGTLFARRIGFTSTAEWARIDVNATGGDPSRTARTLGNRWVPPQTEAISYDADGNLTSDARWIYRWDGEPSREIGGEIDRRRRSLPRRGEGASGAPESTRLKEMETRATAPNWVLQNDVRRQMPFIKSWAVTNCLSLGLVFGVGAKRWAGEPTTRRHSMDGDEAPMADRTLAVAG